MSGLNSKEKKAAVSVAILISLRMYGLFLIMPVFSVYAKEMPGTSPLLIGLALGIYGLTQALLQIPLGLASDFFGRKKVLTIGLLLFITGSIIAALADNIQLIILGRAIQGMGAIASTGMALIADVSRAEQRTKMMAMVGMSIGMAFILAFITGPILSAWFGLKGLFWITAILAGLALIQLHLFIEEPANKIKKSFSFKEMSHSLKDLRLVSLDTGVFVIHAVMTAVFVVLPLILVEKLGFPTAQHWKIYLPVLLVSILIFVPMIILHEKKKKYFTVISLALLGLAISQLMLAVLAPAIFTIAIILVFYFAFFNFLEASMPSLLSRIAGEKYRGAAMGAYSTSQFLGAFVGSWIAGGLMSAGYNSVFIATALLILLSSVFIALMSKKIQSLP
ncbi:MAG TPA: MFS transporter [Gammaproteobacteria bacterium]|nr:MFS transporter [Gammaproteobacteria bacterium]HPI96838.1 MFS transporter [Gammaproteobacteria bacterium]HPQ88396.1 MFS transporter [Gammaproteobacteria bacterium]